MALKIDIRKVKTLWISMKKDNTNSLAMESLLTNNKFENIGWTRGIKIESENQQWLNEIRWGGKRSHYFGVALAHKHVLSENLNSDPLIVLEDDVDIETNSNFELEVPEETDAVWLGLSHAGQPLYEKIDDKISRLRHMLSVHAVLYLSEKYKKHVIEQVDDCLFSKDRPFDVGLYHNQTNFNVYVMNTPIFYQSDAKNSANKWEYLTRRPLYG